MKGRPSWKNIELREADGVIEAILHSGGGPLIWTPTAGIELTELFRWTGSQPDHKILILTGSGDSYCAKLDPSEFQKMNWRQIWSLEQQLLTRMLDLDLPVIAAVNGAVNIHSDIPLLADIVLACPETVFADPYHFQRNVVPGDGVNLVWSMIMGSSRAGYFVLTGKHIDAEEAKRLGAVHEVHPRAEMLDRAMTLARELAEKPAALLTYTKAALRLRARRHFRQNLVHHLSLQGLGMHALGYCPPE